MASRIPKATRPLALAAAVVAVVGCGGDGDGDPATRLQQAVRGLGGGVAATGSGFGWVDLEALRGHPLDTAFAADALGPGADDLVDDGGTILDATGRDPGHASEAVAIGGSYALGVRFDGMEPARLPALLRRAGAEERTEGAWELFDLGNPAESETGGPLRPFGALASRVATSGDAVVFARFDGARESLTGTAGTTIDLGGTRIEPALGCLGDVVAARLVPGTFTHNPAASPELIAMGVRDPQDGVPPDEVLCAIDDSERMANARAAALEAAFAEGARDPVTGQSLGELAAAGEVGVEEDGEYWITRVELERPEGAAPGFLFAAFVRGSLLAYLGATRPVPEGT